MDELRSYVGQMAMNDKQHLHWHVGNYHRMNREPPNPEDPIGWVFLLIPGALLYYWLKG